MEFWAILPTPATKKYLRVLEGILQDRAIERQEVLVVVMVSVVEDYIACSTRKAARRLHHALGKLRVEAVRQMVSKSGVL